ncbi:hypothetical protein EVAR_32364_1 [Eumeta japonica]|uniref:Uncharacterized protein n=1 Tax=Eumeta variegata TaxID=151549 RepID=A0A4C1VIC6_EUMVA|nr:hypothetical protein EVAR_32364_1 [Eumeta japonica]
MRVRTSYWLRFYRGHGTSDAGWKLAEQRQSSSAREQIIQINKGGEGSTSSAARSLDTRRNRHLNGVASGAGSKGHCVSITQIRSTADRHFSVSAPFSLDTVFQRWLPRHWLRRNMPFFAAFAPGCSSSRWPPPPIDTESKGVTSACRPLEWEQDI